MPADCFTFLGNLVMLRFVATVALCLGLGIAFLHADDREEPGVRIVPLPEVTPNLTRIRNTTLQQVLRRRVSTNAVETPLNELMEFLKEKSSVTAITLDRAALESEAISLSKPVTFQADEVTLGQALHRILEPLALTWRVTDSGILITTKSDESKRTVRVTGVGRLVDAIERDPSHVVRAEPGLAGNNGEPPLVHAIHRATTGPWNVVDGAGGSVALSGKTLIVRGTERDHEEVEVLLGGIQLWREGRLKHGSAVLHPQWSPTEDDDRIVAALKQKRDELTFDGTPLKDAIQFLSDTSGVRIILDTASFEGENIDPTAPVQQSGRDLTLQAALDMILEPFALTAIIDHGFLVVMTKTEADTRHRTIIYDVRDLMARIATDDLIPLIKEDSIFAWGDTAGEGSIVSPLSGCLIVRHSDEAHRSVVSFLQGIRETPDDGEGKKKPEADTDEPDRLETRFYPILREGAASQVQTAIVELVTPESWSAAGGRGVAHVVEGTLVVRQSRKVHKEIAAFLKALKSAEEGASP